MSSTPQTLAAGLDHHRAGRFHEAEVIYRSIVSADPQCAEAWRLLAMIALEARQHNAATEYVQRALSLQPNNSVFHNSLGIVHDSRGDRLAAADAFRRAVQLDPNNAEAHNNLGACLNALGRADEALGSFREAIRIQPDSFTAHLNLSRTLHHLGRLDDAVAAYREVLRLRPDLAEAHFLLSQVFRDQGRVDQEIASLRETLRLTPNNPEAHNHLGLALARAGQFDKAAASFQDAVRLRPGFAGALSNLGNAFKRLGRLAEAEQAFLRAIRSDPMDAALQLNLGYLHEQRGELGEALVSFQTAAKIQPGRADAYRAQGRVLDAMGRPPDALAAYKKAVELNPRDPVVFNELANLYQELSQFDESERTYKQALEVSPGFAPAHSNLGYLLADQGRTVEAEMHYREALRLQPSARLRVVAESTLPPIYSSQEEMLQYRERLATNLRRMFEDGVRVDPTQEVMPTLFYIAYHGMNDRDLMAALGRLGQGLWTATMKTPPRPRGGKIQLGFLSRNLKNHTIGGLMCGVIENLDRSIFDVIVLSVGHYDDRIGKRIRQCATRYVEVPPSLPASLHVVAEQSLDILFYPDIGMDPFTYTLAFTRLAPVQVVTWGHPVTTGLPTMDYFISSEDLDPPDGQSHYTEKLARLRTLSIFYERPVPPTPLKDRSFFGLTDNAHIYACPQTLFKFHPDFDELLGHILRGDPEGIVTLIEGRYPSWNDVLQKRFERTIPDVVGRIRWVQRQSRENYLNLLAVSDLMLDPTHFGGGNSSYEGLALGIPIVTLPSEFLKDRITYALYKKMGVTDGIVSSREEYVRVALELGTDPARRQAMREKILASAGILFEDHQAVRELGEFLRTIAPRR
jgi:predicted O-linked N-acetylglucosamine transferase (SPINDLY family)